MLITIPSKTLDKYILRIHNLIKFLFHIPFLKVFDDKLGLHDEEVFLTSFLS